MKTSTKLTSPKTEHITFRVSPTEKRAIQKLALKMELSQSGLIRRHFVELFNTKTK